MSGGPLRWLRRHPFAVEAFFDRSVVLTYTLPAPPLRAVLPGCLELDTFDEARAVVAVAAVQTRRLRPRGLPRFLGLDFLLVGYRVFVRYRDGMDRSRRGLYILRSETDRKSMEVLGNLLTGYRYRRTGVELHEEGSLTSIGDRRAGLAITVDRAESDPEALPPGSPFADLGQARRYAGPLPLTFSVDSDGGRIVIIEGVRSHWEPRPVRVVEERVPWIAALADEPPALASAFVVERVLYRWKKGVVESLPPPRRAGSADPVVGSAR